MIHQHRALVFALLAVACWSTAAAAFKLALRHTDADSLVVYSAGVALIFMLGASCIGGSVRELAKWKLRDMVRSAILGALNPFLYYVILFRAYELLPAQEAQPLNFTWPLVLVILSAVLFGQKIRAMSYVALLVSFCGVVLIATHGNPFSFRLSDPLGVALALGSTVVWSLYWLYSSNDHRNPVNRLLVNFAFGFAYVLVYCLVTGRLEAPSTPAMIGGIYIGLMEMGIAFVFWLKALRAARNTAQVGNLIYLTPFLSLLVIAAVVGERILPSTWIGLMFIVGGIVMQSRFGRRETVESS